MESDIWKVLPPRQMSVFVRVSNLALTKCITSISGIRMYHMILTAICIYVFNINIYRLAKYSIYLLHR